MFSLSSSLDGYLSLSASLRVFFLSPLCVVHVCVCFLIATYPYLPLFLCGSPSAYRPHPISHHHLPRHLSLSLSLLTSRVLAHLHVYACLRPFYAPHISSLFAPSSLSLSCIDAPARACMPTAVARVASSPGTDGDDTDAKGGRGWCGGVSPC
jgi:hypothetical protein